MIFSTDNLCVSFDEKTGKIMSIQSSKGKEFFKSKNLPLFFLGKLKDGEEQIIISDQATFSWNKNDEKLSMKFVFPEQNIKVDVVVSEKNSQIAFSMKILNNSDGLIEYADFPCITVPRNLEADGGNGKIFWPAMEGVVADNIELRNRMIGYEPIGNKSKGWEGLYPGACQMQFMAYYDDEEGLYLSANDENGNVKGIEYFEEGEDAIRLQYRLFTGTTEKEISFGYEIVLRAFVGDWYDAADIYRSWLRNTKILSVPKLKNNKDVPSWVYENPVVVIYCVRGQKDTGDMSPNCYYPYTNALPYIEKLNQTFDSPVMALLMHWEGTAPWAPPYVWPPYGGEENFNEYADELHKKGNFLGVYCSGLGWTQESVIYPSYHCEDRFEKDNIESAICLPRNGKKEYSKICARYIRWGYDLCTESKITQDIVLNEISHIIQRKNVDYIQFFDQNCGGAGYLCYSSKHGHPPVPGKWQTDSIKNLFQKIKSQLINQGEFGKVAIGCEAAPSENFINNYYFNDMRSVIDYNCGVPVPAYNFVFNEYVQNYMGNMNSTNFLFPYEKYPETAFYRYGYAFAQGDMTTLVLKDGGKIHWDWGTPWDAPELDQAKIIPYFNLLHDWRKGLLKNAFFFGRMEKPLKTECPKFKLPLNILSAHHTFPGVITTRFVYANEDLQILVNYRDFKQKVKISNIPSKQITVYFTPRDEGVQLTIKEGVSIIELAARSVAVVKLK